MKKITSINSGWVMKQIKDIFLINAGGDLQRESFSNCKTNVHKYPIYANAFTNDGLYGYTSDPKYKKDSITITARGEIGHALYREEDFDAIVRLIVLQPIQPVVPKYVTYFLNYTKPFMVESTGVPQLTIPKVAQTYLYLPQLQEQLKIAEILSTWDDAIDKTLAYIQNEKRRKKSIISKIYRGQVSESNINREDFKRLKHFLIEVSSRNNGAFDNVLSVSNSKGFIPQDEQFEREVASKDRSNYKVVRRDEFAYNPSRVNVGSIDQLTTHESGILSPMYVVFKCNNDLNNRYLYHFLKSDLFLQMIPKYTQGSVRDSLSFDGLCSMKLYIPTLEEQIVYAQALDSIDEYIKKLEQFLELYKHQKNGLMQQLLTGKIRVNVN